MQVTKYEQLEAPTTMRNGPTLFEVEYIRELQKELSVFLQSKRFPTMKNIVLGIQGTSYQAMIPITSGE